MEAFESHDELEIQVLHTSCVTANLLDSYSVLPKRQAVIVALVLNRFDWLWDLNLTIVQAIEFVGPRGLMLAAEVERRFYRSPKA